MTRSADFLLGTLDLLVLKALSWGPAHGYAIARWIEQLGGSVLEIGEGSLYPALYRLEERDWVVSKWQLSNRNRPAKVYTLTPKGRARLRAQSRAWSAFVDAVGRVLVATKQPS